MRRPDARLLPGMSTAKAAGRRPRRCCWGGSALMVVEHAKADVSTRCRRSHPAPRSRGYFNIRAEDSHESEVANTSSAWNLPAWVAVCGGIFIDLFFHDSVTRMLLPGYDNAPSRHTTHSLPYSNRKFFSGWPKSRLNSACVRSDNSQDAGRDSGPQRCSRDAVLHIGAALGKISVTTYF